MPYSLSPHEQFRIVAGRVVRVEVFCVHEHDCKLTCVLVSYRLEIWRSVLVHYGTMWRTVIGASERLGEFIHVLVLTSALNVSSETKYCIVDRWRSGVFL